MADEPIPTNAAPDLAGYPSVDELAKAYRSSSDEGKRQRQRADQLAQHAAQLEQQLLQRQPVPDRSDPASRLRDYGIPTDELDQFVAERVSRVLEPLARGAAARNTMLSSHPDYGKYEAEVARYLEQDQNLSQTYQRMFAVDPAGAMEFAFLKYGETRRRDANGNGSPRPQESARAEAQLPSSRQGDARTQSQMPDEMLTRAWEHYQKTGDARPYAKMRLKQVITDDFLTGRDR